MACPCLEWGTPALLQPTTERGGGGAGKPRPRHPTGSAHLYGVNAGPIGSPSPPLFASRLALACFTHAILSNSTASPLPSDGSFSNDLHLSSTAPSSGRWKKCRRCISSLP